MQNHERESACSVGAETAPTSVMEACRAAPGWVIQVEVVCPCCGAHKVLWLTEVCECCNAWVCTDCDPRGDDDSPGAYRCPSCRITEVEAYEEAYDGAGCLVGVRRAER